MRRGMGHGSALSSYLQQKSREGSWQLSRRQYADGSEEYSVTPKSRMDSALRGNLPAASDARGDGPAPATVERSRDRHPRDVATESAARARRVVVRLARYTNMQNMWTLTFPGAGVHDYETAYRLVSGFIHYDGAWVRSRAYEAVPELHPGGHGWHWHVLFNGPRMPRSVLVELQRAWTRYVRIHGEVEGWDGKSLVRHHVKRWSSARCAARYAGKYVAKSVGEGLAKGRHRYLRGEGLELPAPATSFHDSWIDALSAVPHSPQFLARVYDGRPSAPFIWCSWDPPPT